MFYSTFFTPLLMLIILVCTHTISASDSDKEMRWFEQINESIMTGDTIWLEANEDKFMAIYTTSQTDETLGGIILVHGLGLHADWADIIHPLRTQLPEKGWVTLSIQMPILQNNAKFTGYLPLFDEVPGRFEAAIKFLHANNIKNVAIVGHSLGSVMSIYYLSQTPNNPITAFVGIGTSSDLYDNKLNTAKAFSLLKLPILDLYGSLDLEPVITSAKERNDAATQSGNKYYTQKMIPEADHFFTQMNDVLIANVNSWLMLHASK